MEIDLDLFQAESRRARSRGPLAGRRRAARMRARSSGVLKGWRHESSAPASSAATLSCSVLRTVSMMIAVPSPPGARQARRPLRPGMFMSSRTKSNGRPAEPPAVVRHCGVMDFVALGRQGHPNHTTDLGIIVHHQEAASVHAVLSWLQPEGEQNSCRLCSNCPVRCPRCGRGRSHGRCAAPVRCPAARAHGRRGTILLGDAGPVGGQDTGSLVR